jgi:sugar-specific transcriptional regulator TrmB
MFEQILSAANLNPDEASIYETLVTNGSMGAGMLLKKVQIKRGLLYKTLERLKKRDLVIEQIRRGRAVFSATPPDAILRLAEDAAEKAEKNKAAISSALAEMKAKYALATERPVFRFFEGVEGLRKLYEEKLESPAKEYYFVRPLKAGVYREVFGDWFSYFLKKRSELGVATHALTPDDPDANHDPAVDKKRVVTRTWTRPSDYTAPIEINVSGNRTEIVSFGKEIFAVAIDNKPIAQAFTELIKLAITGAKTIEVKHDHP